MNIRLCECGHCRRCKRRVYQRDYMRRLAAGLVRHGQHGVPRKCDCGDRENCPICRNRERVYDSIERRGRRRPVANVVDIGPDLDETRLNAYFDRVKTWD